MIPDTIRWKVVNGDVPDELYDFFFVLELMPSAADSESICLTPLWDAFPGLEWGSIHWRMGEGEGYKFGWLDWFATISAESRSAYMKRFPEPDRNDWPGFYAELSSRSRNDRTTKNSPELKPVWDMFPDVTFGSHDWKLIENSRMITVWIRLFGEMDEAARRDYITNTSEPEGWDGFYQAVLLGNSTNQD